MRVVASLTTMPDKYSKIITTLKSLNSQTHKLDAIYLGLPQKSRRLGLEYPPLPKEAEELCTVVKVTDYGPITKLLGGLLKEQDPSTVIITFDDDMYYPPTMVEKLVQRHKEYPDSAIGSSGMLFGRDCPFCAITPNETDFLFRFPKFYIPKEGRRVDSVFGYAGALYVRKFFPSVQNLQKDLLSYSLVTKDTLMNDDITISGYLSKKGIERRIFDWMPGISYIANEQGSFKRLSTEISHNGDDFFRGIKSAIQTCKSFGMYQTTEQIWTSETIAVSGLLLFLGLILFLLGIWYLIQVQELEVILPWS